MQNRTPLLCDRCRAPADASAHPPLEFAPVPRKHRHDGWTAARQREFIEALASTGSVTHAAKAVNMSTEGAYYLRRQPGADAFRDAWNAALDYGVQRLVDVTMERAIDGVTEPVMWRGEQVGERRVYNDRLAMFHLRHRLPGRYGPLTPPGRGTLHPETAAREAAAGAQAEDDAADEFGKRMRLIRRRAYQRYAADPALRAAWELLNEAPLETLLDGDVGEE